MGWMPYLFQGFTLGIHEHNPDSNHRWQFLQKDLNVSILWLRKEKSLYVKA